MRGSKAWRGSPIVSSKLTVNRCSVLHIDTYSYIKVIHEQSLTADVIDLPELSLTVVSVIFCMVLLSRILTLLKTFKPIEYAECYIGGKHSQAPTRLLGDFLALCVLHLTGQCDPAEFYIPCLARAQMHSFGQE